MTKVHTDEPPVVEIDPRAGAVYVRFQPRAKVAKTVVRNQWPHIAIDLDRGGRVIGVEALGMPEFTITTILRKAELQAPKNLLGATRYMPAKSFRRETTKA